MWRKTYSWTPLPVLFAVTLSSSSPVSSPWRRCTSARRLPTLFSTTSPRLRSLPKIFSGYFGRPVGIGNYLPGVPQSIRSQNQHRDAALLFHRVWHLHTGIGKGCGSTMLFYLLQKAKKTYSDSRGRRNLNNLNTELQDVQRIMVQVLSSLLAAGQSQD